MMEDRKIFFVIFLCSFSSLAYEITLTRIFSISLWYHFAFMIISIAMLGIGASGTILSLYPKLRNPSYIRFYSLLVGIAICVSYLVSNRIPFDPVKLSWAKTQLLYVSLYYITLSMPFFFAGLLVATALSSLSAKSGLLYGADLCGAGTGSLGILFLMTVMGPDQVVFIISSIPLLATFLAGGKSLKKISIFLILLNLSVAFLYPKFIHLRMSPYKGLEAVLRYPGAEHFNTYYSPFSRIDLFKSPSIRFAPGLSLRYLDPLPEQIGVSIDGGEINAITTPAGAKSLTFLEHLPSALPYEIEKRDDVLILDPKGGLQVLVAAHYKTKNIYKIESNPLLLKIISRELKEFSGDIYSQKARPGLGRSWLKSTGKKFDLIDISLLGTFPSGSFGISEDYRFTVEAFKEYLNHLTTEGFLSINLFLSPPPRIELRLLNTLIQAMEELKTKDVERQIVALRSWGTVSLLTKRSPFTMNEVEAIREFSKQKRFDLLHYPGIKEEETNIYVRMPTNAYFEAFRNILNSNTRHKFTRNYIFDVKPVRDENPFFHYYLKFRKIKETYQTMGEKWQFFIEEGYLLPVAFAQVLLLTLVLVLLPAVAHRKIKVDKKDLLNLSLNLNLLSLSYFALIGIGFMFVEIPLIQKTILPLEHPSYGVATVLISLLIGSGIGSLLSHRISRLRTPFVTLAISLLILASSTLISSLCEIISPYPLPVKTLSIFFALMPIGFLMGIPFPVGLKILGDGNESLIPWAWAINGCFSILAPILAIMFALVWGFRFVLWAGAAAYLLGFLTSFFLPRRSSARRPQTPTV